MSILAVLLLCFPAYCQVDGQTKQESEEIEIYFNQGSYAINLDLSRNKEQLETLNDLIDRLQVDTLTTISKIEINSCSSPEGCHSYNKKLSERRTNSIYGYLTNTISVPDSLIDKQYSATDWNMLQTLVEESDMQYKDEVLHIIKNVPEETWRRVNPNDRWLSLVDSRNKHLMDLKYGNPYRWMYANLFPQLRNGSVVTIYFQRELTPIIETIEDVAIVEIVESESESESEPVLEPEPEPVLEPAPVEPEIKPLIAVKTNLLYDAVTALNMELEIPIGERWSIAGEWIFPWWSSGSEESSNRNCFQLLNGNLEGKYWFGDRTNRPVLTGWHIGLYAGGGLYDLEHNKQGYQGEFFIASGLSGGYAHTINKSGSLRMEYSVAVGYLRTNYDKYTEYWQDETWVAFRDNMGYYSWLGPTRARVSLVWLLNCKARRR